MDARQSQILRDFVVRHRIETEFALNILSTCGWNPIKAADYLNELHCNPNSGSQSTMSSVTASAVHRQHQQQQPQFRNIPIQVEARTSTRSRDLSSPSQSYSPIHVQQTRQRAPAPPGQRSQIIHVSQDTAGIQSGSSRSTSRTPATSYVNTDADNSQDHKASTTAYSRPFGQASVAERYATGRDAPLGPNAHVSSVHIDNDLNSNLYNGQSVRPSVVRQSQLSGNSVLNSQERTVPIHYANDGQQTSWKTHSTCRPLSTDPIITAAEEDNHFNVTSRYPPSNILQSHTASSSSSSYPFYVEQSSSSPVTRSHPALDSQYGQPVTLSGGSRLQDAGLPIRPLQQREAIDETLIPSDGVRTLKRGISKTSDNFLLVTQEKDKVLHDIHESPDDHAVETAELTFTLPNLDQFIGDYHCFLEKELIEMSTLVSLQQAGCLNWWYEVGVCQKLWPMATTGDGNCLLHAASLAMWGFHDRNLILRKALFDSMTTGAYKSALFRRWRYQQTFVNKQSGLIYSEDEWHIEWDNLLRLASAQPRRTKCDTIKQSSCCDSPLTHGCKESSPDTVDNIVYESLEEFHVFVLAHVLRRPVIVVADKVLRDTNGDALAPIPFGGIFLPLECRPETCHRSPLLLTYDAAHFSALVPMEAEHSGPLLERSNSILPAAIPLVDCQLSLLTLHFAIDPGERFNWSSLDEESSETGLSQLCNISCDLLQQEKISILQKYMDFQYISVSSKLVDEMCESDGERKSSGSMDSDESAGSFSGNSKDMKDRQRKDSGGNNRMQQQMQSVAKGFGSIGKSVSKRLKALGKGGLGKVDKKCVGSIVPGSVVASGVVVCKGEEKASIPCAKLSTKRSTIQDQLVMNYIADAKKRFEKDQELKQKKATLDAQQKAATLPRLSAPPPSYSSIKESQPSNRVRCVQPNCSMYGSLETSYLCSDCYSRSKREAEHLGGTGNSNAHPETMRTSQPETTRTSQYTEDFVHKEGKSKFYVPQTPVTVSQTANVNIIPIKVMNDDEKPERKRTYHVHNNINPNHPSMSVGSSSTLPNRRMNIAPASANLQTTSTIQDDTRKRVLQNVTNKVGLDRSSAPVTISSAKEPSRSPSPYDNINKLENRKFCRNDSCSYYGSKETDDYCSQCYKSMHKPLEDDPSSNIGKTRL